jgi:ubiquitin-protein ligase
MGRDPPPDTSAGPVETKHGTDWLHWKGMILGPADTPYAGGLFAFTVEFPLSYPFKPPRMRMTTPIWHAGWNASGATVLDVEQSRQWSPALSLSRLLTSWQYLLKDWADIPLAATANTPARDQFLDSRAQFEQKAREWTLKFAK